MLGQKLSDELRREPEAGALQFTNRGSEIHQAKPGCKIEDSKGAGDAEASLLGHPKAGAFIDQ
jgi:hypothetical protein